MDLSAEFEQRIQMMEYCELMSSLEKTTEDMLKILVSTSSSTFPISLPMVFQPDFEPNTSPSAEREERDLEELELSSFLPRAQEVLYMMIDEDITELDNFPNQEQTVIGGQPVVNATAAAPQAPVTPAAPVCAPFLAVPPIQQYNGVQHSPIVTHQQSLPLYNNGGPAAYSSAGIPTSPLPHACISRKRSHEESEVEDKPYIKKPPNAFMLFVKEKRAGAPANIKKRGSTAVNTYLGQVWKSLTKKQQSSYYEQAEEKKRQHNALYPGWSTVENYGKKKRRRRTKVDRVKHAEMSQEHEPLLHPLPTVSQEPHGPAVVSDQTVLQQPHASVAPRPSFLQSYSTHMVKATWPKVKLV